MFIIVILFIIVVLCLLLSYSVCYCRILFIIVVLSLSLSNSVYHCCIIFIIWYFVYHCCILFINVALCLSFHDSGSCNKPDERPSILKNFHYMYFSLMITLMTGVLAIVISLLTEPVLSLMIRTLPTTKGIIPVNSAIINDQNAPYKERYNTSQ
jgi:hypothetical protein